MMNRTSSNRTPTPVGWARQSRWLSATMMALLFFLAQCHGQGTMQPLHITFDGPPAPPPGSRISVMQYDGLTSTPAHPHLAATVGVQVGVTVHVEIVIADEGDAKLDAGVFIKPNRSMPSCP